MGLDALGTFLVKVLESKHKLIIPIYQRLYSWKKEHCKQLFDDIVNIAESDNIHFIGSIVSVEKKDDSKEIPEKIIIDGQQRLTTVSILICALIDIVKKDNKIRADEWKENYLINKNKNINEKYKLCLTKQDRESFIAIVEENSNTEIKSKSIKENYEFFVDEITTFLKNNDNKHDKLFKGIRQLKVVWISIDADTEDPQIIFESLNSTGMDLKQSDLIRNFILMGKKSNIQEDLYNKYWYEMEKMFGDNYNNYFDSFMRDYLTIKNARIPTREDVYKEFKVYLKSEKNNKIEDILQEIYNYATYFITIKDEKETDKDLLEYIKLINKLKVDVCYPFLMVVYNDYINKIIDKNVLVNILKTIEIYVFRRWACSLSTNALNKIFASLYNKIEKKTMDEYLESFYIALLNYGGKWRFPKDDEFEEQLTTQDFYNTKHTKYWLDRIENFNRKEKVNIDKYSVEHIMPQKRNVDWNFIDEDSYGKYLHRIGNLTLTGYNSEMSNRSFLEKKKYGFNKSTLTLNAYLQKVDKWDIEEIEKRGKELAKNMLSIWEIPAVDVNKLKDAKDKKIEKNWTLEQHTNLTSTYVNGLFTELKNKILAIDENIEEDILKLYIAYKINGTNFVCIEPQSSRLKIHINIDISEVKDSKNICKDVKDLGHWGTGDTKFMIDKEGDINYGIDLINQAFNKINDDD
jgi:uncharacterized protein with ParB-like and HNH nuclease domain/predicted transport protein